MTTSAVPEYATFAKMLAAVPEAERSEMRATYESHKAMLLRTFQRGRVVMWEDGRARLVSRRTALAGCSVCVYDPPHGTKFRLSFGRKWGFLSSVPADLVVSRVHCGEEGYWILKADPRLADALPQFQKAKPSGKPFDRNTALEARKALSTTPGGDPANRPDMPDLPAGGGGRWA